MWQWLAKVAPKKLVWFCLERAIAHSKNSMDPEFKKDAGLASAVEQHWKDVTFSGVLENKPVTY